MSTNNLETETVGESLWGIFAELFGAVRSRTSNADISIDESTRAVLACALEALRYYLDVSARAPTRAEVRWYHARADDIFSEFMQRSS